MAHVGWASRRWAVPVTLTTRFDTASITKLFTAVAALQLVDQWRLGLDPPIVDVVELTRLGDLAGGDGAAFADAHVRHR
jgi:CubicO group peptidase (beta-lactamase class C family)